MTKIIIIGGVAAGAKCAAKARRMCPDADGVGPAKGSIPPPRRRVSCPRIRAIRA